MLYQFRDEIIVEATPCTYQEFKAIYRTNADTYHDLIKGYDVEFMDKDGDFVNIFIPNDVWDVIAYEY